MWHHETHCSLISYNNNLLQNVLILWFVYTALYDQYTTATFNAICNVTFSKIAQVSALKVLQGFNVSTQGHWMTRCFIVNLDGYNNTMQQNKKYNGIAWYSGNTRQVFFTLPEKLKYLQMDKIWLCNCFSSIVHKVHISMMEKHSLSWIW